MAVVRSKINFNSGRLGLISSISVFFRWSRFFRCIYYQPHTINIDAGGSVFVDSLLSLYLVRAFSTNGNHPADRYPITSVPPQKYLVGHRVRLSAKTRRLAQPSPHHVRPPCNTRGSYPRDIDTLAKYIDDGGSVLVCSLPSSINLYQW